MNAVKGYLQNPDIDVNVTDSTAETPLHKACNTGNLKILELLLKQNGIKISPKSDNGETPLHIASRRGNLEAARLLLDAELDEADQCDINMPDSKGLTPLCYATKLHQRRNDMVKFLLERYFVVGLYYLVNETYSVPICVHHFAGVVILVHLLGVQLNAVYGRQKMLKISLNCVVV